ncbi:MAG: uL13 family ribosomal protein [Candidatus Carsonella ruddii]
MIIINCKKKILGRISSVICKILLNFFLLKKNINILLFNINKLIINNKKYFKHSGYIGNLKIKHGHNLFLFKKCLFNMLPKNKIRLFLLKKIFFFENKI